MVKVWNLTNCKLKTNHFGHIGYVNTTTISPDGTDIIHSLTFSPNRYWLCAATAASIKIWDLESKSVVDELKPEVISMSAKTKAPECISLAWSADGQTLFAGYTDNLIRVWQVTRT